MNYATETIAIATPIGMIAITGNEAIVSRVALVADSMAPSGIDQAVPVIAEAAAQLRAYFARRLERFDLPLEPCATPRGEALRKAIADIPYGEALSYGALARIAGSGPRAIGQACARNPFPIIIPCHRVLAANGRLGAYSAGDGPLTKQWLLDHEGHSPKERIFA